MLAEDYAGSEEALLEAIELLEAQGTDDPNHLVALSTLARLEFLTGGHAEGARIASQVASRVAELNEAAEPLPREALWLIVPALEYAGEYERASKAYEQLAAQEGRRETPSTLRVANAYQRQATAEWNQGNAQAADSLFHLAVELRREVAPTDVGTGSLLVNYSNFASSQGEFAKADSLATWARSVFVERLGPDHLLVGEAELAMAQRALDLGRFQEAADRYAVAEDILEVDGSGQAGVLLPIAVWRGGEALWRAGRPDEAEPKLRRALGLFRAQYADDYLLTANVRRDLGTLLARSGDPAEAIPILESALGVLAARWGDEDFRSDGVRVEIARALNRLGETQRARELLDEIEPRLRESVRTDHPYMEETRRLREIVGG
jgi:tetratricopeptide (TPR) repeat protein